MSILKEKPNSSKELLQNTLIQDFIKKKLTKMIEISTPVIKKPSEVNTSVQKPRKIEKLNYDTKFQLFVKKRNPKKQPFGSLNNVSIVEKVDKQDNAVFILDSNREQKSKQSSRKSTDDNSESEENEVTNISYENRTPTPNSNTYDVDDVSKSYVDIRKELSIYPPPMRKSTSKVLFTKTPQINFSNEVAKPENC